MGKAARGFTVKVLDWYSCSICSFIAEEEEVKRWKSQSLTVRHKELQQVLSLHHQQQFFIFYSHPLPWSCNDTVEILHASFLLPKKGRGHSRGAFTSITKHLTGVTPTRIELGWDGEVVPRHSESNPLEDRSCLCNRTVKVCFTLITDCKSRASQTS